VFPPLAVLDAGCGTVVIVGILTLFGWVPGTIAALIICNQRSVVQSQGQPNQSTTPSTQTSGNLGILFLCFLILMFFMVLHNKNREGQVTSYPAPQVSREDENFLNENNRRIYYQKIKENNFIEAKKWAKKNSPAYVAAAKKAENPGSSEVSGGQNVLAEKPVEVFQANAHVVALNDDGKPFRFIFLFKSQNPLFGASGYLRNLERVCLLETKNGYARLKKANGIEGWIVASFLKDGTNGSVDIANREFKPGQQLRINLTDETGKPSVTQGIFKDWENPRAGQSGKVVHSECVSFLERSGDFIRIRKANNISGWLLDILCE